MLACTAVRKSFATKSRRRYSDVVMVLEKTYASDSYIAFPSMYERIVSSSCS